MTQQEELLIMLKEAGTAGVNSYGYARKRFLQLPYLIHQLRKQGHQIFVRRRTNRSVDYILHSSPKTIVEQKPEPPVEMVWEHVSPTLSRLVRKEAPQPEQQQLL